MIDFCGVFNLLVSRLLCFFLFDSQENHTSVTIIRLFLFETSPKLFWIFIINVSGFQLVFDTVKRTLGVTKYDIFCVIIIYYNFDCFRDRYCFSREYEAYIWQCKNYSFVRVRNVFESFLNNIHVHVLLLTVRIIFYSSFVFFAQKFSLYLRFVLLSWRILIFLKNGTKKSCRYKFLFTLAK